MSHKATNWAFEQRGLKPSAKLILLALADCHNPVIGCFPSQDFLADKCEINRDTVNANLSLLEERGLIRRIKSVDPVTKRRRSTRYKLAFEDDFATEDGGSQGPNGGGKPMSENPTRAEKAMSENPAEPCRKNPESHVGNSDTNLVREPIKEPSRARAPARGDGLWDGEGTDTGHDFELFWQAYPKPRKRDRSLELWRIAKKSGADPQRIISAAQRYRQSNLGKDAQYLVPSDRWLEGHRWETGADESATMPNDKHRAIQANAEMFANKIREGKYVAPSALSAQIVDAMRAGRMLTDTQLTNAGVRI